MFSFHRPKVYRSPTGCCICKAKSSSSRFTDSKKYEEDFLECFKLVTPRQGEICNACVLLVKRWKKLPVGSDRNWQHVVDARAGPGMKSFTKFKSKNKKIEPPKQPKKKNFERETSPASLSDKSDVVDDIMMMDVADIDYLDDPQSPGASDNEDPVIESQSRRRKVFNTFKRLPSLPCEPSDFIDPIYWKPEVTCCGPIYLGRAGEIMYDPTVMKLCPARLKKLATATSTDIKTKPGYSDSSSDSGYDDSSNQAASPDTGGETVPN